ncbi:MAG: CopG-like 1 or ribbon-helix-helix domain, 5 [Cyanobacteriota bacterium]
MPAHSSPQSPLIRSSRRISITVPHHAFSLLQERSDQEGRSLSNLAAYLLESSMERATAVSVLPSSRAVQEQQAPRVPALMGSQAWS